MFRRFLWLEWKSFFRSASFGKSLGLKILMIFLALYFAVMFLLVGFGLYPIMKKLYPGEDPLEMVNRFALAYFALEFVMRFMLQTLPVMDIKPLMIFPIKKRKVVNYVLLKSLYSFYNILPLLLIIPFGIINIYKGAHGAATMLGWMVAVYAMTLSVNFLNFIVKKRFTDNLKALIPLIILVVALLLLDYFDIFSITDYFGRLLNVLIEMPYLAIVPVVVLVGLYKWNQLNLESKFYLDAGLKGKAKSVDTKDFGWTKKFGSIAPFLQLDLKMIWRNKRPKTTVYLAFIFLAYGLLFYTNDAYQNMPAFFVFVGIFTTGIFMINFGQFVPSWDAGYYSMIMAQNIPMKQYLASKLGLITFSVVVLAILSTPYAYFGYEILLLNLACALYNMGVNAPLLLYAGSFNKKRIDLDKSPFMNYQGTGASQWLVGLPLLLIPIFLFWLIHKFLGYEMGVGFLAVIGIIGLLTRPAILKFLETCYRKRKYATIQGFKQKGE
ncbi:MAG: DUF5687 family protein [Bacteroidota bacterium]|uniref:Uncharacterized protein n=1 Tax=Christiangramia flava JLT2011 TaxID=1229726 RepID=A0A1L7I4E1_9FLAO|nr:DUF5687 family protein [Christiangramia flava]APU68074.1 hypothetical protein GRFL_1350 [Christiangramia flava JLT2011]MEE2771443.1 DUF5687 family protein [Bacteroidota bacterium]OSS40576.1 hypothetical protein C723_0884 [Christiangramia flava JLT2011]